MSTTLNRFVDAMTKGRLILLLLLAWLAANTDTVAQTGPLSYIKIVAGASGNGPELGNTTLNTDQTLTMHATGFDANGNYLGDQTVTWSLTGGIGTLSPAVGTITTILDAMRPGTGMITADHPTVTDDVSGTITVSAGAPFRVKVLSGVSGNTTELAAVSMTVGQTLAVHAGGFDADDNYLGDFSVNWSLTGGIGTLNPGTSVSTIFTAATAGSGVIAADHATLIDDVSGTITVSLSTQVSSDPILSGLPQDFKLLPNYPNPFHAGLNRQHSETRIGYELPVTSRIAIAVYNLNGQLVHTLFDGQQSAGRYSISWDGTTNRGDPVVNGIYLVRMKAGRFVAVRKIVVAK